MGIQIAIFETGKSYALLFALLLQSVTPTIDPKVTPTIDLKD